MYNRNYLQEAMFNQVFQQFDKSEVHVRNIVKIIYQDINWNDFNTDYENINKLNTISQGK